MLCEWLKPQKTRPPETNATIMNLTLIMQNCIFSPDLQITVSAEIIIWRRFSGTKMQLFCSSVSTRRYLGLIGFLTFLFADPLHPLTKFTVVSSSTFDANFKQLYYSINKIQYKLKYTGSKDNFCFVLQKMFQFWPLCLPAISIQNCRRSVFSLLSAKYIAFQSFFFNYFSSFQNGSFTYWEW